VSDASHQLSPGWNLVEIGEDVPLESQFISTAAIPKATLQRGRELAERYGW
jgi:methanogenic corrinoid protein MtbC1